MRVIKGPDLDAMLHDRMLIERLRQMFRSGCDVPLRHHHSIPTQGDRDGTLLLMPAWKAGRRIGIKIITVFPNNPHRGIPSILGSYLMLDGETGVPQAMIDGPTLTARRTAAASALAASYLARQDSNRLLVVGTGTLAGHLIQAYQVVLPIRHVLIWGRSPEKAKRLATHFSSRALRVEATEDLEGAVRGANVVTCATGTTAPLIKGQWLTPGVHLDLIGGFTPAMREADDDCIRRARVFVDTRSGACAEAGDIVQPLNSGILSEADIAADLFELARGERSGRRYYDQITLFKSVGTALEDLAAAELALDMALHHDTTS